MSENILSIFIDESGDFGPYKSHAPYYIVTMVLHEQSHNIGNNISTLKAHLHNLNFSQDTVHVGPLIRREQEYFDELMENRKRVFNALFNFARKLPITYLCVKVKKRECTDIIDLTTKLSKSIIQALKKHTNYFKRFDKIIIYYDNGQIELTRILIMLFNALFPNVEFRKVKPSEYKLFQVADLICSMELLTEKAQAQSLSRSELDFFQSAREFKKNYYKYIKQKHI